METFIYYYILFTVLSYLLAMVAQNIAYHKFRNKKSRAMFLSLFGPISAITSTIFLLYIIYKNNEYKATKQKHF